MCHMVFLSFYFYLFVALMIILYYVIPLKYRWCTLLAGSTVIHKEMSGGWLKPVGISFFTLQLISYAADIYRGTVSAQKNYFI